MASGVLGVIPARLASTRLAEKPLHPILGRPLIEWVWERARDIAVLDELVVATDSDRVAEVCRAAGAVVETTSPDHASGTDRVAEVAALERYRDLEVVVNIQGDEPLLRGAHVRAVVELVLQGWDVGTCAAPVLEEAVLRDPDVVKVARAHDGRALYFSRAGIPFRRDGPPGADALQRPPFLRHVGLYAYTRSALERWTSLPPSPLERLERLEQLRALEAGFRMGVAVVDAAEGGVDTPADVLRVERRLRDDGSSDDNANQKTDRLVV